ncbi:hypothetical protein ACROYT_G023303 [Oculina patagonica]
MWSNCRVTLDRMACGDVNVRPWYGVIMKNSCNLHNRQSTKDCQTVQQLDMTLQKELPVFNWARNVTYRSIACARCSNEGNFSFWGLQIKCAVTSESIATPVNITTVKTFLKEHPGCSWKYAPRNPNQRHESKSCVLPDTQCASNQLPVLSVVRELCSLYSMVFSVNNRMNQLAYRNPHCALCNPDGRPLMQSEAGASVVAPLSILLDVSSNIPDPIIQEPENPPPTLITGPFVKNLTSQVLNCTTANCTVAFGDYTCENFTSTKNQSTQMRFFLNKSHGIIFISQKHILYEKNALTLQGNTVYIVCPEQQTRRRVDRNLPGKCLINLSLALLFYQAIFLSAAKSKEVDTLCKAVAVFVHFFLLATFSWMSIMAFDTASTFTVKVTDVRRHSSDTRKTFIKYCIVGWGLPAVAVGLCSVLDFTGTLPIGYGISTYCWISDKTAIAIAMVTPVSLALVFNVMCLTKNIYAIRHLQQGASQATNNISRVPLTLICIKLTTVMGLTWILGLIANWKHTAFLQYPSAVLNSMQGFFIALCFITTKKVRGLLKNGFIKQWNGAVEPQTSVTRDQRTGNTDVETALGTNTFNMKALSSKK